MEFPLSHFKVLIVLSGYDPPSEFLDPLLRKNVRRVNKVSGFSPLRDIFLLWVKLTEVIQGSLFLVNSMYKISVNFKN